jgi:hypothetical protein
MRIFSFAHVLLILVFLLAYQCAQAQDYAVTVRGDTLYGDVRLFNYGSDKKVQVQPEGKRKEIIPLIQTSMVFLDGDVYKPQKGPAGYAYMKVIKEGFLSLYAFQPNNQVTYDGRLLAKRDGSSIEVPNLSFKKAMTRFLQDCPSVVARIESGDLGRKDLDAIIDQYNNCNKSTAAAPVAAAPSSGLPATPKLEALEAKVREQNDLPGKQDVLDMITEIRNKVKRGETVPNFLMERVRRALKETELNSDVEEALKEIP